MHRCPGDQDQQQVVHKCLPQAHPHEPLHAVPFPSPPEDCHCGVLRCMWDRVKKICDPTSKQKEIQRLQGVFQANGFPAELVNKTLSHRTHPTPPQPVQEDPAEPQKVMFLRVGGIHFFQYRLTSHYNTSVLLNTD